MANCVDYNCSDALGDQILLDCDGDTLGGVSAVVFLECDHQLTNPSVAAQYTAEIAAGRAHLYEDVEISITKASPVKITPPAGCAVEKVINYDRAGTYRDGNVNSTNVENYNTLFSGKPLGGIIIFECKGDRVTWIDSEVRFEGDRLIPASQKEIQTFDGNFNWTSLTMPMIYDKPVGIFD